MTRRRQILALTVFVLALRVPFLNQAIQGDDVYYLYGAEHAQIDPLHPTHARYAFLGQMVDMRGQPHPPLDAWSLAALLAVFGDVKEIPFHAAYILFSLLAAYAALALARRFTPRPLAAALLLLVTPAFVVNGNSFESDLPFLAFWLASIALFVIAAERRSLRLLLLSAGAMVLAAMAAYQAVLLAPILLVFVWIKARNWKPAWVAAFAAPAALACWQLYERASSGALPAAVLAGYMQTYGLQTLAQKWRNAAALTAHLGWLVFPLGPALAFWRLGRWAILPIIAAACAALLDANPLYWVSAGVGVLVLVWCARKGRDFLAIWALLFFGAALILFFAGSARYLLPMALPVAILVSRRLGSKTLAVCIGCELGLSLALAVVNYQHWDGYRQFAAALRDRTENRRVWINGEWGLRYYLESDGGLPLLEGQAVHPGDVVVSSRLAYPMKVTTGGGVLAPIAQREITSEIPLRLVALNGRSGYSTASKGLRPFDISLGPIDEVKAEAVIERKPTLTRLPMNSPESGAQIVSGIYDIENGQWRWMSGQGALLLKTPSAPTPVQVRFYIPPQAPAREITVWAGGRQIARQHYAAPGAYTLTTAPVNPSGDSAVITIHADKTFSVPGDHRELGIILIEAGFAQ